MSLLRVIQETHKTLLDMAIVLGCSTEVVVSPIVEKTMHSDRVQKSLRCN